MRFHLVVSTPPHLLHIIRSATESIRVLPVFGLHFDLVSLQTHCRHLGPLHLGWKGEKGRGQGSEHLAISS